MTINPKLISLLERVKDTRTATEQETVYLLGLTAPEDVSLLFKSARDVRARHFNNQIYLYGFLYFSTYCQNNCNFCQFRNSNKNITRYRKSEVEIVEAAKQMVTSGVHLVDLTMGEDPELYGSGELGSQKLVHLVKRVSVETGLPLMLSPGCISDKLFASLDVNGVDWYACYQETHNRQLFKALRPGQDYDLRLESKIRAKKAGLLIEEGILVGAGETLYDIAHSIKKMEELDADQVRAMTFVPHIDTPMGKTVQQGASSTARSSRRELITIAVMRLILQDRLIPASLDVDGIEGLMDRLNAGANVVTSIVPPHKGLSGVANQTLDIDESKRSRESITPVLKSCNLEIADNQTYQNWITSRRNRMDSFIQATCRA
jgi:methylornithine synthase